MSTHKFNQVKAKNLIANIYIDKYLRHIWHLILHFTIGNLLEYDMDIT